LSFPRLSLAQSRHAVDEERRRLMRNGELSE